MRRSEPTRQRRSRPHKMPRTRAVKRVRKDCIAFLRGAVVSGQPHCATENATLQLVSLVAACRGRAEVATGTAQPALLQGLEALFHFGQLWPCSVAEVDRRQARPAPRPEARQGKRWEREGNAQPLSDRLQPSGNSRTFLVVVGLRR